MTVLCTVYNASHEPLAIVEAELSGQIAAAQRRVAQADVPPELQALLAPGEDVRTRWEAAPMAARRRAVAALAEIRVGRAIVNGAFVVDDDRLGSSRWIGEQKTWGERWAAP